MADNPLFNIKMPAKVTGDFEATGKSKVDVVLNDTTLSQFELYLQKTKIINPIVKNYVDNADNALATEINKKANSSTTLNGYGISDSYTKVEVNELLNNKSNTADLKTLILDLVHPIGSLYWSSQSTEPSTLFGGTWKQITDTFVLAAGTNHAANADANTVTTAPTGQGAETHAHATQNHTLTYAEVPAVNSVNHCGGQAYYMNMSVLTAYGSGGRGWDIQGGNEVAVATDQLGSGGAHNHGNTENASSMPPYLVRYCWERIS